MYLHTSLYVYISLSVDGNDLYICTWRVGFASQNNFESKTTVYCVKFEGRTTKVMLLPYIIFYTALSWQEDSCRND